MLTSAINRYSIALCSLLSGWGRLAVPVPAAVHTLLGDDGIEPHVPPIARELLTLLECISEADQALRPVGPRQEAVVVAATPTQPRARLIPGDEWYEGDGNAQVFVLEFLTERFGNAEGAGPQPGPRRVLGERHGGAGATRQEHALAGCRCDRQERGGRHFTVGGRVAQHDGRAGELAQGAGMVGDGLLGRGPHGGIERPPPAAHLLPNRSFCAVHPVPRRIGTGARGRYSVRSRDRTALPGWQRLPCTKENDADRPLHCPLYAFAY
jgi:hypothetical protein